MCYANIGILVWYSKIYCVNVAVLQMDTAFE
jgi:hypothetical protein